jgi:heme-degrading monooxygenase HmoA
MITRVVEIKTKPGQAKQLCRTLHEQVLAILQTHKGFIDEIVLIAEHDADMVIAMSFWKTKADAEDFHEKHFKAINQMIQHLVHVMAKVHLFSVETSTVHHVAKGKAGAV